MKNPFRVPLLMFRSRRPSRINDMPALHDAFWLRRGYEALTFFGTIVTATQEEAQEMNRSCNSLKTHEMIHLMQARDTRDSWLWFYLLYLWYYVQALPMNCKLRNAAYLLNPFELEAYRHMEDADYLNNPACGTEWRRYARMSPRERWRLHTFLQ